MAEYQAIYKCRLCGEEYVGCGTGSENIALASICGLTSKEYFYPKGSGIGVHRVDCHNCKDGSFGLADFMGFRKVE